MLEIHSQNKKDDTTPWLLFTKSAELFEGRDVTIIANTRCLNTDIKEILEMSQVNKSQLRVLNRGFDRILA